jgi:hypothetical protein
MQPRLTKDTWLLAQASLKYFCVQFLGFHWPDFYQEWYDSIETHDRLLIECARGHGKSNLVSLGYPLWRVIRGNFEGVLVSYSEDQAKRLIGDIRGQVMSNPLLEPIRPSTAEDWSSDRVSFPNNSKLKAIGFGTSARGLHPKWIGVDDPLKDTGGMTPEDQDRAYFGVIEGMAMPGTKISVVGTPVGHDDLLTKLEDPSRGYVFQKYPAFKQNGDLLFPQIWNKEALELKRVRMGSLHFAREYLLERVDPETQPFKSQFETLYEEVPVNFAWIVTVCDPAYSENDGDETAIVTVGLTHGNHGYVLEAKGIRREDPGKIVDELMRTINTWKPGVVGIEKRRGDALSYTFNERRARMGLWNFKFVELSHGSVTKANRINAVGGLVPRWEARTIHVHRNQRNLLRELYEYRLDDSHRHDDLVDALAYCFHPDVVVPNQGRSVIPQAQMENFGKALYTPGRATHSSQSEVDRILHRKVAA